MAEASGGKGWAQMLVQEPLQTKLHSASTSVQRDAVIWTLFFHACGFLAGVDFPFDFNKLHQCTTSSSQKQAAAGVHSTSAYNAFTEQQREAILRHVSAIVHSPIDTLENVGGGGVRCTLGELF
eukprot:1151258-Pelagomonas_calceolata.AAC.2